MEEDPFVYPESTLAQFCTILEKSALPTFPQMHVPYVPIRNKNRNQSMFSSFPHPNKVRIGVFPSFPLSSLGNRVCGYVRTCR